MSGQVKAMQMIWTHEHDQHLFFLLSEYSLFSKKEFPKYNKLLIALENLIY